MEPAQLVISSTAVNLTLDVNYEAFDAAAQLKFRTSVAETVGVNVNSVIILHIRKGSVIISLYFKSKSGVGPDATLAAAFAQVAPNTSSPFSQMNNVTKAGEKPLVWDNKKLRDLFLR